MIRKVIDFFLGDFNEKQIKKAQPLVDQINQKEQEYQNLSDEELKAKTEEFKQRIADGEFLDNLLVEAFATVKNACRRMVGQTVKLGKEEKKWDMIPYDCQLLGGIFLHQGRIAEMKTGEGKTLVAALPLYLNALTGKGAHLVTVNDYLAKRDAEWIGVLYNYLGLTVGTVVHGMEPHERQEAYGCDITYGTNNEFGFDYLRDNMAVRLEDRVQRPLNYAIVDEVDSILIDEARTPLIISAPAEESTQKYYEYSQRISQLKRDDHYVIDEKARTATLTEAGIAKMEQILGVENIYTDRGFEEVHHIEQALKAKAIFEKDKDYLVKDDEVIIVDEFTGRLMPGRRYSDGLHQAIEAKENVEVKRESKTLATITFQNYFRLYNKLAGMTGTAKTEEEEFYKIYNLETIVIPTNKPISRQDHSDYVFKSVQGKWKATAEAIKNYHEKGQPVLVGTVSVETSEMLSKMLKLQNIPHEVLNAKHHEREAEIVSLAGQKGAVTIATNMAGRGTDIKLGDDVKDLGGLAILGTERHDSRRIDNQLRGRSGRQGDPGESRFYVSMDDSLMRLFGSDKIKTMMDRLGFPDDEPIDNIVITRGIEHAQKRVEGHNFDIRKHVLEYDDVMNKHREIIYARRLKVLENEDLKDEVMHMIQAEVRHVITLHTSTPHRQDWDLETAIDAINALLPAESTKMTAKEADDFTDQEDLINYTVEFLKSEYQSKEDSLPDPAHMRTVEKRILLHIMDRLWMEHIDQMTRLRENVALRGYGQRDPLMEYKREAFLMFKELLGNIEHNTLQTLFKIQINVGQPPAQQQPKPQQNIQTNQQAIKSSQGGSAQQAVAQRISADSPPPAPATPEAGRNEPCPCGSGKKYKKCCGK